MNFINIEDIMMRNQALVVENQALRLRIEELKNGFEGSCMACEPVGEMNKKLREERDEALKKIDELEDVCGDSADRMVELVKERDEARLEVRALQKKIGDTSIMLYDWDGYYNPHSQSGNIVEMAKLVEEAYSALQGRSWNEENEEKA